MNNTRTLVLSLLSILILLLISIFAINTTGHAPQSMILSFDFESQELNVTITHNVADKETHYIETVEIYKNSILYKSEDYTSQPSTSTFSYNYSVTAEDGDVIKVTSTCSITGSITEEITVEAPEVPKSDMKVNITTDITDINENVDYTINISISFEENPLTGVNLSANADLGTISTITEVLDGTYQFTYTAADVAKDESEEITLTAKKEGFNDYSTKIQFSIINVEPGKNGKNGDSTTNLDGVIGADEYDFSATFGDDNYKIHWKIEGDIIQIGIAATTSGWVAIGIDPEKAMKNADMIFGWVDGSGSAHVEDAFSEGESGPHPTDISSGGTDDIIDYGGRESSGWTIIEFTRELDTGDSRDKKIKSEGEMDIIWAYSSDDNFNSQHSVTTRGSGIIDFATGKSRETEGLVWIYHAAFMVTGYILILTGSFIAKTKRSTKWWMKVHKISNSIGTVLVIIGLGAGIYMVQIATGQHLRTIHSIVAIITIILTLITVRFGFQQFNPKLDEKRIKLLHRKAGRITMIFLLMNILSGFYYALLA